MWCGPQFIGHRPKGHFSLGYGGKEESLRHVQRRTVVDRARSLWTTRVRFMSLVILLTHASCFVGCLGWPASHFLFAGALVCLVTLQLGSATEGNAIVSNSFSINIMFVCLRAEVDASHLCLLRWRACRTGLPCGQRVLSECSYVTV
jgi:hypothetical protein